MSDIRSGDRRAAELAAYEQIGEQELAAYVRENVAARIADLRKRLPSLFIGKSAPPRQIEPEPGPELGEDGR